MKIFARIRIRKKKNADPKPCIPQEEDEDEAAEMEEMPVKEEAVDIDPTQFLEENNEVTEGHFMFSLPLSVTQYFAKCLGMLGI